MDLRSILLAKLKQHPELSFEETPTSVRIDPPSKDGFSVSVQFEVAHWTVYLGEAGFHRSIDTAHEALDFIAWCYSGEARLRQVWRGKFPAKIILEALRNGSWISIAEVGYFLVPFWLARHERVLTNPKLLKH